MNIEANDKTKIKTIDKKTNIIITVTLGELMEDLEKGEDNEAHNDEE